MKVEIDGVLYVPVSEAHLSVDKIIRGLLMSCSGEVGDDLDDAMEGICVSVNDWGDGLPIEEVIKDILEKLNE